MRRYDLALIIAAAALVAGGAGFALGHDTASKTASASQNSAGTVGPGSSSSNGFGGGGGFRRGGFGTRGTVTAVSGSAITVSTANGATKTVNVSASTTYLNGADRTSSSLSAVTTGITILASGRTNSDGSINATRIIINPPNFGGGGGAGGASTSGPST